jgi:hypothetical protein
MFHGAPFGKHWFPKSRTLIFTLVVLEEREGTMDENPSHAGGHLLSQDRLTCLEVVGVWFLGNYFCKDSGVVFSASTPWQPSENHS